MNSSFYVSTDVSVVSAHVLSNLNNSNSRENLQCRDKIDDLLEFQEVTAEIVDDNIENKAEEKNNWK